MEGPSGPARSAAFAFMASRGAEREALALASSLRTFGGALGGSRMLALVEEGAGAPSEGALAALAALGAETLAFEPPAGLDAFPLAGRPAAAAAAEAEASRGPAAPDVLVWMDPDTIILREPSELLLPAGARLGFRPVHHVLIGSPAEEEPDAFWRAVYAACGTEAAAAFPVTTTIDRRRIRFYPNAGLLALRPGDGLLRRWRGDFERACEGPELSASCGLDPRTRLFAPQALLAATLLAALPRSAMRELGFAYNYPLHLHASCPARLRPARLEELATLRYDGWARWREIGGASLPAAGRELADWLRARG